MERKVVAAFIADIYQDMVKETEYGTISQALEDDIKLLFFASFSDNYSSTEYTRFSNYDIGDVAIYKLPNLSLFDGLITYDSYLPDLFQDTIRRIKDDCPCPVVCLGDIFDDHHSVVNDHMLSLQELVDHVIDVHHCKELIHVAGNLHLSFSQERLQVFKASLDSHKIPHDESNIVIGDLWYGCGPRVVDEILQKYKSYSDRKLPDAIICANDYMAIGVIDELIRRGYKVPEDVIVTGYDDVIQSRYHDPTITTSSQPFEGVGRTGVQILEKLWKGEKHPMLTALPGIMQTRQSCGCHPRHSYQEDHLRDSYATVIHKLGKLSQSSTNLILSVSSAESDEDVFREIEQNCCTDTGFKDAVLCLMDGWERHHVVNDTKDFEGCRFEVVCGKYNGESVKREILSQGELLPKAMMEDPNPYYLIPIHHMQYFLGYFIVSPELKNLSQANIKSWFINISTMLENWHVKKQLQVTIRQMEIMYTSDTLTGLFNRRGYTLNFPEYYQSCADNRTGLAVFLIDMDNLKITNDTYGHDEGDYCITTIGRAMKLSCQSDEICIRSGGDEFIILARNYDRDKADALIGKMRDNINSSVEQDKKPYSITFSIGCYLQTPPEGNPDNISRICESYLQEADKLMYAEKKSHKEAAGK